MRLVIDTNVLVAGLRSSRGASFLLLEHVGTDLFHFAVSVPLVIEYEAVLTRRLPVLTLEQGDLDDLLDYLCATGVHHEVFYLWRPTLRDPADDMVLELAVGASCDAIVTYNSRDFRPASRFGIRVLTPREVLAELGVIP